MTERLDRIEAAIEAGTRETSELRATVNALVQIAEIQQRNEEVRTRETSELRATINALVQIAEVQQRNEESGVRETAELRAAVDALVQTVEIHQQNFEVMQRNFDAVLTEIRGLRTETQRLLDLVLNRSDDNPE